MSDMDAQMVGEYLDNAQLHGARAGTSARRNDWGEGYWLGRAVEYARQNAVDYDWVRDQMKDRGLDASVLEVPKPGDQQIGDN